MTRIITFGRQEAEILVDFLDRVRGKEDYRLDNVADAIREQFGMVPYEVEYSASRPESGAE